MNVSRRDFFSGLGLGAAALAMPGCVCPMTARKGKKAKIALQLYSVRTYIGGEKDKQGTILKPGVGLARALQDIAAIGYKGVEFAGYYDNDAKTLRSMLADAGLAACGTHVATKGCFGLDTETWSYDPEVLKKSCEFNLGYGNNLLICPGGGNMPPGISWTNRSASEPSAKVDEFIKRLCDGYNKVAQDAAKCGCRIGLHNHEWEFNVRMMDDTSFWDYFFSNTDPEVCMEQDVGWTTCAGEDPAEQYEKYPHRSPTLHAKENGMGPEVKSFDAILGKPGEPGADPVAWDEIICATEKDGVEWYVVECERHQTDLSAVLPSYEFLKQKGLN